MQTRFPSSVLSSLFTSYARIPNCLVGRPGRAGRPGCIVRLDSATVYRGGVPPRGGAPSMARSSVSLLPTSESAGLPVAAGRAGGSSEVAVAAGRAGGSSEVAATATAAASVVDAGGVVRGRVEVTLFAG